MKHFFASLFYFGLFAFVPLSIVTGAYLYYDPFKVLKPYDDYSYPFLTINRDYISTTMFIKNYQRLHYNSFILGSSRTLAFRPNSWSKYLGSDSPPFMFDASGESIYGIYTKVKFMDSIKAPIKTL